jgi:TolA-binding protein
MVATKAVVVNLVVLALYVLPGSAMAQRSGASSYTEDRISQFQQTISELTRRLQELQRQNQQLEQKLEKMQASYEQRLERLEKGAPTKPPPARKAPAKP